MSRLTPALVVLVLLLALPAAAGAATFGGPEGVGGSGVLRLPGEWQQVGIAAVSTGAFWSRARGPRDQRTSGAAPSFGVHTIRPMDLVTASAALFAAISAGASAYTGWKMRQDVRLSEASSRYELVRSFEMAYDNQYEAIFRELGGWPDPIEVDPKLRRVVHDIVVTLSSIYNARSLGLLSETEADYLGVLFSDWLRAKPEAYRVWREVFDTDDQREGLPRGFSEYVEKLVGHEAAPAGPTGMAG